MLVTRSVLIAMAKSWRSACDAHINHLRELRNSIWAVPGGKVPHANAKLFAFNERLERQHIAHSNCRLDPYTNTPLRVLESGKKRE